MRTPTRAHVQRRTGYLLLALVTFTFADNYGAGSAAADEIGAVPNPYARPRKTAKRNVHSSLASAVSGKIANCYRAEQGAELDAEQLALLTEYAADVVRDLASALEPLGCALDERMSAACTYSLDALSCEALAQPIIDAGWDRNLTPEAKAKMRAYAAALAAREAACEGRAADEAAIVQEIGASRLSALLESEIVMGKCELLPEEASACDAQIASANCGTLMQLKEEGQLTHLCSSLLRCTDAPAPR